jgi:hypothetical protein
VKLRGVFKGAIPGGSPLEHGRRRLVIVCILLDCCRIASPASPSLGSSTLCIAERCHSGCHPEDVLLHINSVGQLTVSSWPAAAGRAAHLDRFVSGVVLGSRYEASLRLVKQGFTVHEEWRQFHGAVEQDGLAQRISFAFPPLPAGRYTEHFAVYDACGLSASLVYHNEEEEDRLLAKLNRVVDVEEDEQGS